MYSVCKRSRAELSIQTQPYISMVFFPWCQLNGLFFQQQQAASYMPDLIMTEILFIKILHILTGLIS